MTRTTEKGHGPLKLATRLITGGRNPDESFGFVSIPPYRGSTVLYPSAKACLARENRYAYGLTGNPSMEQLNTLWSELEGAEGSVALCSGAAACTVALLAVLSAGDHLLVPDSVYRPTRNFCNGMLKRMGIETTYYDPMIGGGIRTLFKPNTRAIFTESPGSHTFEVQDIPAIVAAAREINAFTLMDNTWATAIYFKALDFGIDISINAATKYPSGHSDVLAGMIAANARALPLVKAAHYELGQYLSPDDTYTLLRGLRSMDLRLREQGKAALEIAHWLKARPEVLKVLHPALPDCPGHEFFKRDFTGSSGLFGFVLKPGHDSLAFIDATDLFGVGFSWGGFESLMIPVDATSYRTATPFAPGGACIRIQIGLENIDDLKADLDRAFKAIKAA